MSSNKRQASHQLTHDNWENEEASEEAGVFQQADESEMKSRVIRKAKRRGLHVTENSGADEPVTFSGFKGFGIPTVKNPTFSFNSVTEKQPATTSTSSVTFPTFGSTNGDSKPQAVKSASPQKAGITGEETASETSPSDSNKSKFLGALKALNEAMLKWLQSHTDKNPYCYFTPVFTDYAKHLANLKEKYKFVDGAMTTTPISSTESTQNTNAGTVTPPRPTVQEDPSSTPPTAPTAPTVVTSPSPKFSFGSTQKLEPKAKEADSEVKSSAPIFPSLFNSASSTSQASDTSSGSVAKAPLFSFGAKPPAPEAEKPKAQSSNSSGDMAAPGTTPLFSFGNKTAATSTGTTGSIFGPSAAAGFSFGLNKPATTTPPFLFGNKPANETAAVTSAALATTGFSFKSAMADAAAKASSTASSPTTSNEDDEYVPPKPEVENKITEEDAVYTARVKLFYTKEDRFVDKGIGNLFIKPLESGKYSLLIRADTNLGNILLNISLAESIPVKRMGKNNVTLLCVPNPPMEPVKAKESSTPAPTMLLVRVKTEDDADQLCEKLCEYKNKG